MKSLSLSVGHDVPQLRNSHQKSWWQAVTMWGWLLLSVSTIVGAMIVFKAPSIAKSVWVDATKDHPTLYVRPDGIAIAAKDSEGEPMSISLARSQGAIEVPVGYGIRYGIP